MLSLHEWQQQFLHALMSDLQVLPENLSALDANGKRLAIHRTNWQSNLCQVLRLSYPVIERLVGREFFDYCGIHFIAQWPSHSANLDDYGREFPAFLRAFPAASTLPYLGDVAALEVAIEALGTTDDEQKQLRIDSPYPVLKIWQSNQPGFENYDCINLDAGADLLLIRREKGEVMIEKLHE